MHAEVAENTRFHSKGWVKTHDLHQVELLNGRLFSAFARRPGRFFGRTRPSGRRCGGAACSFLLRPDVGESSVPKETSKRHHAVKNIISQHGGESTAK